jgi:hypothetical protein
VLAARGCLVLGYQRCPGRKRTLVSIKCGREAAQVRVRSATACTRLRPLHPAGAIEAKGMAVTAPPRSVQVFDLR